MTKKIIFRLEQGDDGYPPASVESLWAEPAGAAYIIDSIPFFTSEATVGDRVLASGDGQGALWFDGIEQPSGHSLIRVVLFDKQQEDAIVGRLEALGCGTERMQTFNLLAVDVPEDASLTAVQAFLSERAVAGILDYQEAILRQ